MRCIFVFALMLAGCAAQVAPDVRSNVRNPAASCSEACAPFACWRASLYGVDVSCKSDADSCICVPGGDQ